MELLEGLLRLIVALLLGLLANYIWSIVNRKKFVGFGLVYYLGVTLFCYSMLFDIEGFRILVPRWIEILVIVASLVLLPFLAHSFVHRFYSPSSIFAGKAKIEPPDDYNATYHIIDDGMLGYMKKCIAIEDACQQRRLIVYRHLPSYMRRAALDNARHAIIRRDWTTDGRKEYQNLTNDRLNAILRVLDKHTVSTREIYEAHMLKRFAETGMMFSGQNPAPPDERIDRIECLIALLKKYNEQIYDIKITSSIVYFPFMICDNQMIIDVGRQTNREFSSSLGGLYSNDVQTVDQFCQFFNHLWRTARNRNCNRRPEIIEWLSGLKSKIQ